MKYQIVFRDKKLLEITQEEYDEISSSLGFSQLFKLKSEAIVNMADVMRIEPFGQGVIPECFRLKEPELGAVGGNIKDRMDKLWHKLKESGLFGGFNSPDEYRKSQRHTLNV